MLGRRHGEGRSARPSLHLFDVGVVTARAQDHLHVGIAAVAPVPAMVSGERGLQHTFIGCNTTTLLVADRLAGRIAMCVEVDLSYAMGWTPPP